MQKRQNDFKLKSSEIFTRFQNHLNNGCNGDKPAAPSMHQERL